MLTQIIIKGNAVLIKQSCACYLKTTYADSIGRILLTEIKTDEKIWLFIIFTHLLTMN